MSTPKAPRNVPKPPRNASLFEAASRGFAGLALGFGALTTTALSSLPDLLGEQSHVAAIYAEAIPKSAGAAVSAVIASVALFAKAHQIKNFGNVDASGKRRNVDIYFIYLFVGFSAFIWHLGGLYGLAMKLSQVVANLPDIRN